MWSVLENVPCAFEKVYSSAFGWNVLKILMRAVSSNVSSKTCVSLLISCFDDLSVGVSGVLKFPTIFTFKHWKRKWQPTQVFLPGESQGQGSLVGCRLWGHIESDTTEVT